jgi:murein DD-endopeptidase MepM/ murein hydrolase activator NlpD
MRFFYFFFLFIPASAVYGQYPVIARLDPRADVIFKQYLEYVEDGRRLVYNFSSKQRPADAETLVRQLTIYEYKPKSVDDFYSIASSCNIPQPTLASLNRIAHPEISPDQAILLPSLPGIFIPLDINEDSANDLEKLMIGARLSGEQAEKGVPVMVRKNGESKRFFFIPDVEVKFTPTEAAFFLTYEKNEKSGKNGKSRKDEKNGAFRYPLRHFILTSNFGMRKNPVTGAVKNHNGLDLAAPAGAEVFAAQAGVVTETGNDAIYGNYVIVKHKDGWASLYGHLSKIETALNAAVAMGALIGRVGSTGQSTGPHLHFELRRNGKAQDPGKYLFRE